MSLALYVNSDNLIQLDLLRLAATGGYVNDATVTFTLKDADEVVVVSGVSMPYVAASNGRYQGTLQDTVSLTTGLKYFLEVTATSGANVLFKRVDCYTTYKRAEA